MFSHWWPLLNRLSLLNSAQARGNLLKMTMEAMEAMEATYSLWFAEDVVATSKKKHPCQHTLLILFSEVNCPNMSKCKLSCHAKGANNCKFVGVFNWKFSHTSRGYVNVSSGGSDITERRHAISASICDLLVLVRALRNAHDHGLFKDLPRSKHEQTSQNVDQRARTNQVKWNLMLDLFGSSQAMLKPNPLEPITEANHSHSNLHHRDDTILLQAMLWGITSLYFQICGYIDIYSGFICSYLWQGSCCTL